ncbi:homeobox protein Mohawk isoform X3 [Sitodiplosis mosellana]|uniref:homeobox protein Mohawk isoform X3 n=1 Tax=Sitodiplosis mosellana TaxID=263140 RepID=UPI002444F80B|nr:homeobox protein Mohawk isoform X3 [Sitodiplosis mosellana]
MIKLKMDKGTRPIRSRMHSRRSWTPVSGDLNRPVKRLFTPEIKRMLKDWLVRRRENPYPSREEKKSLAQKTGLTYIQICNWFANWRRKLKNAGKEPQKNTWGNLIKNYNTNARGNVEQFSICSSDSIWEDEERRNEYIGNKIANANRMAGNSPQSAMYFNSFLRFDQDVYVKPTYKNSDNNHEKIEHLGQSNADAKSDATDLSNEQCYQVSSTTNNNNGDSVIHMKASNEQMEVALKQQQANCFPNPKYKNQIMEKYLQSLDSTQDNKGKCGLELSKWLESAAKFTPEKNNYIEWDSKKMCAKQDEYQDQYLAETNITSIHQKEELDAAEALTFLAGNFKSRWVK